MRSDPAQPEDIEGQVVDRAGQRRRDRQTHLALVALGLLSALFFAGALAYAVGSGLLGGEGAPSDGRRPELPRQWSNMQPFEPIGPDSGVSSSSGGGRARTDSSRGRGTGTGGETALASTAAGTAATPVLRQAVASPIAAQGLTRRWPVVARVLETRAPVRLPSIDGVGSGLPDLPGDDLANVPEIDPFPDGLEIPPVVPFPDGLEVPPVDLFPGGVFMPPGLPAPGGVDVPSIGQPLVGGLPSLGRGNLAPLSALAVPEDAPPITSLAAPSGGAAPLVPVFRPLSGIGGDSPTPPRRRRSSVAGGSEPPTSSDRPRRRGRADRRRKGWELAVEGTDQTRTSTPGVESSQLSERKRARRQGGPGGASVTAHGDGVSEAGDTVGCAQGEAGALAERAAPLKRGNGRHCESDAGGGDGANSQGDDDGARTDRASGGVAAEEGSGRAERADQAPSESGA
jgi:hypothetical protein